METLGMNSKMEQAPIMERGLSSEVSGALTCSDKSMEQTIRKILLRYLPKDVIDGEKVSMGTLLKCFLKEKPIRYMVLEKFLNYLGCKVKVCELTRDELEELKMELEVGSSSVGV